MPKRDQSMNSPEAHTLTKVMDQLRATGTTTGIIGELMDYPSFVWQMGIEEFARREEG